MSADFCSFPLVFPSQWHRLILVCIFFSFFLFPFFLSFSLGYFRHGEIHYDLVQSIQFMDHIWLYIASLLKRAPLYWCTI